MPEQKQLDTQQAAFRKRCYDGYVSSFKSASGDTLSCEHPGYRRWLQARYGSWLAGLPPTAPILDLGCGAGEFLCFLRQEGFTCAEGLDLSPEQVAHARERGCTVEQGDAFSLLPQRSSRYSVVCAIDLFEHFSRSELSALLDLIHTALVPGGLLLLRTPNGTSPLAAEIIHDDLTHATILGPQSLAQLLRLARFEEICISESGPIAAGIKGTLRTWLWRLFCVCANGVKRLDSGRSQPFWSENLICCCRKAASGSQTVPSGQSQSAT